MLIKFNVNLGSRDASIFGLKLEECMDGVKANVSDEHAAVLIARGLAGPCESPAKTPKELKAVPQAPEVQGKDDKGKQ